MYKNQQTDRVVKYIKTEYGVALAYHMNKNNWITVVLDGGLSDEMVFGLIRKSFLLTD